LPALTAIAEGGAAQTKAAQDVTAIAADLTYAAKVAKYEVRRFLEALKTSDSKKRKKPTVVGVGAGREGEKP